MRDSPVRRLLTFNSDAQRSRVSRTRRTRPEGVVNVGVRHLAAFVGQETDVAVAVVGVEGGVSGVGRQVHLVLADQIVAVPDALTLRRQTVIPSANSTNRLTSLPQVRLVF